MKKYLCSLLFLGIVIINLSSCVPTVVVNTPETVATVESPVVCTWSKVTCCAAFSPRVFATTAKKDNKLFMIGGSSSVFDVKEYYNDVWSSSNGGADWKLVTSCAAFSKRMRHTTFVFKDKFWVVAGQSIDTISNNDVWSSSDGVVWTLVTAHAAFPPRRGQVQTNMVFNNKMWIISGYVDGKGPVDDVWWSENGIDWYAATLSAGFVARTGFSGCIFKDRMWIGGGSAVTGATVNDVWSSSDGITWTKGGVFFPARIPHLTMFAFGEWIWFIGGAHTPTLGLIKKSRDGVIWSQDAGEFGPHSCAEVEIWDDSIILMAGNAGGDITPSLNDVWKGTLCKEGL